MNLFAGTGNAAAVNAAIAQAGNLYHASAVVEFGAGAYIMDGTTTVPSSTIYPGLTLKGQGEGSTSRYWPTDLGAGHFAIDVQNANPTGITIEGMAITGALTVRPTIGTDLACGIRITNYSKLRHFSASSFRSNIVLSGYNHGSLEDVSSTGGRAVTFGSVYKTSAAVPTTANTTTTIRFFNDGSVPRELARSTI